MEELLEALKQGNQALASILARKLFKDSIGDLNREVVLEFQEFAECLVLVRGDIHYIYYKGVEVPF